MSDENVKSRIVIDILGERRRQDAKWGEQNMPDGTGGVERQTQMRAAKFICDERMKDGSYTWTDVLQEEVSEALAETDEELLKAELIQTAAVIVAWLECIERRRVKRQEMLAIPWVVNNDVDEG